MALLSGCCAVLLVKDEIDVIEHTIRHLAAQVDAILVADNASTDGTWQLLLDLEREGLGVPLHLRGDDDPAYYQAERTSRYAEGARRGGYRWVVPCDADEFWYATDGRRISDFLDGLAPDVAYVAADLYNHLPTGADDPDEENPFVRIGWRQREHGALPKVACRLRPGLEIRQGNHSAYAPGSGVTAGGLCVRHFSWRSVGQYQKKLENGARAYAATDLPAGVGAHWRMFGDPDEETFAERVREHFLTWFWVEDPVGREDLIYDPAVAPVVVEEAEVSA